MVVILLLNVMEVLCVCGGALLDIPCWCCVCDPSVHLDVPSTGFDWVCAITSFRSLIGGSQVFALLMLSLCVIFQTMWSGKMLQLLCNLPFGILYLSDIRMMFVKIILAVCMLVGIVV